MDLCGEAERVTLPYFLDSLPEELLAFDGRLSRFLLTVAFGAVNAVVRRTVRFSWRWFVQHLSFLQADGDAKVLGCIREAVDDMLYASSVWVR